MDESRKTKKQLEKEAEQRERANHSFLRGSERLIQWMAFKDFLLNDFYQSLIDLSTAREDQGEPDDFGFSIYLYNTDFGHRHQHFFSTGKGLYGFSALVSRAMEWLDEEIRLQGGEHESRRPDDVPPDFTVAWEMQNGCLHDGLSDLADACETLGSLDNDVWINMHIAFYPTKSEIPKEMDFADIVTESLCYPDSLLKRFESISNDIIENQNQEL